MLISSILPQSFRNYTSSKILKYKNLKLCKSLFKDDFSKLYSSQNLNYRKNIALRSHVIEKGLTMPCPRYGFGQKIVLELMSNISQYESLYDDFKDQITLSKGIILEYYIFHQNKISELPVDFVTALRKFLSDNNIIETSQLDFSKSEYFSFIHSDFALFSKSRHSVRHFQGKVNKEHLLNAISLAQNAPSACNRQSTRVYLIENKSLIQKIFQIQKGNRGFGHLVDNLLLLTTDMNQWDPISYNGGYIDGGIYAMNLLYSLHYYKIGACTLNACMSVQAKQTIQQLLNIPFNESLVLFIAVGNLPEHFRVAKSNRLNINHVLKCIQ